RVETVAMARDVGRGHRVERDDLTVVRVAADPGDETVPADEIDNVVGPVAGSDLPEGALRAHDRLLEEGARLVGPDGVVVGARPGALAAPRSDVPSGTPVPVVWRPGAGSDDGERREVPGWLRDIGDPLETTGAREV